MLPIGPTSSDVLLAPAQLRSTHTYERLARAPPNTEPSLTDVLSDRDAELAPYYQCLQSEKMKKKPTVYSHELLPITTVVELNADLASELWDSVHPGTNDTECRWHGAFKHYRGIQTFTANTYYTHILKPEEDGLDEKWSELGIFGRTRNPLTPVLTLAMTANKHDSDGVGYDLIRHHVAIVCLQFYLCQRNRFFEVAFDENHEVFDDSLVPYMFTLLSRYDVKKDVYDIPKEELMADRIAETARKYDFSSLFVSMMNYISKKQKKKTQGAFVLTKSSIQRWCQSKCFNNTAQFFITSTFGYMQIKDFPRKNVESIVKSGRFTTSTFTGGNNEKRKKLVVNGTVKDFVAPDNYGVKTLVFAGKPPFNNTSDTPDVPVKGVQEYMRFQALIPNLYCHANFDCFHPAFELRPLPAELKPDAPRTDDELTQLIQWQDCVLYRLAKFIDATLLKEMITSLNAAWKGYRKELDRPKKAATTTKKKKKRNILTKPSRKSKSTKATTTTKGAIDPLVSIKGEPRSEEPEDPDETGIQVCLEDDHTGPEEKGDDGREEDLQAEDQKRKTKPTNRSSTSSSFSAAAAAGGGGGKIRPIFHEPMPINRIRDGAYSYVNAGRAEIAHEVDSHLLRDPSQPNIYAQTAPQYYSAPLWKYWMKKVYNPEVHDPLRKNGPLVHEKLLPQVVTGPISYEQIEFPPHIEVYQPKKTRFYLRDDLQVKFNTPEYECICQYVRYRAFADHWKNAKCLKEDLYLLLYALITLLQNESDAIVQLRNEFRRKASDSDVDLLEMLRYSYAYQVNRAQDLYEQLFARKDKDPKIVQMFNSSQRRWRESRFYDAAIPSDVEWKAAINKTTYLKWMQEDGFTDPALWRCWDQHGGALQISTVLNALCDYWVNNDDMKVLHLPENYSMNSCIVYSEQLKEDMSIDEFASKVYRSFHTRMCVLGLCWRMLLPANLIPAPDSAPMHDIQRIKRELPLAFDTIRTCIKNLRCGSSMAELQRFKDRRSKMFPFLRSSFNSMHYLFESVIGLYGKNSCTQEESDILQLLSDLSRDEESGMKETVETAPAKAIQKCIALANNHLSLKGEQCMLGLIDKMIEELGDHFKHDEIRNRIVEALYRVDPLIKPIVDGFKLRCEKQAELIAKMNQEQRTAAHVLTLKMHHAFQDMDKKISQKLISIPSSSSASVSRPQLLSAEPAKQLIPYNNKRKSASAEDEEEKAKKRKRVEQREFQKSKERQSRKQTKHKEKEEKGKKKKKKKEDEEEMTTEQYKAVLLQRFQSQVQESASASSSVMITDEEEVQQEHKDSDVEWE
jgi:hypothetical protein